MPEKIDGYAYFLVARAYVREGGKDGEAVTLTSVGDAIPLTSTRSVEVARKAFDVFDNKELTCKFVKDVPIAQAQENIEQNQSILKISDLVDGIE